MSHAQPALPAEAEQLADKYTDCPAVDDLIRYGLDEADSRVKRDVEAHLRQTACRWCRGWVEKAMRVAASRVPPHKPPRFVTADQSVAHLPSISDLTPVPESPRWQAQVFAELSKRLRELEEAQR
ncbi:MAG: hypothetical protein NZ700_07205 [Gemmataceae bacterium]|nr:hypothetical protein [Gemmataceae bacterium]MDW8266727.1 hypothetical protein [Gemmataceae bacterium]